MEVAVVCCARNEADVIEAFVRHHSVFCARIYVQLHRCLDNSKEILDTLQREGLPVLTTTSSDLLHDHAGAMNELLKAAVSSGATWVLALDADEFVVGDISASLTCAAKSKPLRMPWKTYVPLPTDDWAESNVLRRTQARRAAEQPQWFKVAVPAELHRSTQVQLGFGNHGLLSDTGHDVEAKDCGLSVAHFPIRTSEQVRRKVFGGWPSNVAYPDRRYGNTFQWKVIYQAIGAGQQLHAAELARFAIEYGTYSQWNRLPDEMKMKAAGHCPSLAVAENMSCVVDPVPCEFDLVCPVVSVSAEAVLMDNAESFAMAYGDAVIAQK